MKIIESLLSSDENSVSSKRFISLYCLLMLTVAFVYSMFGGVVVTDIWYVLSGLILGSSGLTMVGSRNRRQSRSNDENEVIN